MSFDEGSVINDEAMSPIEESQDDAIEETESEVQETGEDQGETQETQENQDQTTQEAQGEQEKEQYTEKGTKLDPDPLSAAHQQLANAKREMSQYQQVLNDPQLLTRYAEQMGLTVQQARQEVKDAKETLQEFTADSFKSADDVAKTFNTMRSEFSQQLDGFKKENEELKAQLSGISSASQADRTRQRMESDVSTVYGKYPELNPKSTEYNRDLELEVGRLYTSLDAVNPEDLSQGFKGNVSIAQIADTIMAAANAGKQRGSTQAQTNVKTKQAGRVVTSRSKTSNRESEPSDPGSTIAARIAKAYGREV